MNDTLVYVKSPTSKYHVAVMHAGATLSNERCQLDDIHGKRTILHDLPDVAHADLCRRCFPDAAVQGHGETVTA